ncbi:MAG: GTP-binding protein [Zavarzinella sp.]
MFPPKRIATNLITGFLGVGKTTTILQLMAQRPENEQWAVIVNEYGDIGIDGAILESAGEQIEVREITGGCVCCTSAVYFQFALVQLLEKQRFDRLIIETSGIVHPAQLLKELAKPVFLDRLNLQAVVGIISPHDWLNAEMRSTPLFQEAIAIADVLVLNRADEVAANVAQDFRTWASQLPQPPIQTVVVQHGQIDAYILNIPHRNMGGILSENTQASQESAPATKQPLLISTPSPGFPIRKTARTPGGHSCGWIFSVHDRFCEEKLMNFVTSLVRHHLGIPSGIRLKGYFHLENGWIQLQFAQERLISIPAAPRSDSRLEILLVGAPPDCKWVEEQFLKCLLSKV